MVNKNLFLCILFGSVLTFCGLAQNRENKVAAGERDRVIIVPLGGNTWAHPNDNRSKVIFNEGIKNWSDRDIEFNTWVRINKPGTMRVKLRARSDGESLVQLTINDERRNLVIQKDQFQQIPAGEWTLKDTGYIKIILRGISKTGKYFPEVSDFELSGSVINARTVCVKNNEGNFFYWGRRGPSVHLNYPFRDDIEAGWFYNEITVPEKEDVVGSYYMANGFGEGYFGIQVNSPIERRVLFSVWSSFHTDDPKSIPEDEKIILLRKGDAVYTGEFGNEGSGGQSFLRYSWKAGTTYKFLLNGYPDGKGNTIYTAYFFAPERDKWQLIASFLRPKTNTYLKRFHSFLENFSPDQGDIERHVLFGNQWIRDAKGVWHELNKANFTYDNTAAKGYRKDYAGGLKNGVQRFDPRTAGVNASVMSLAVMAMMIPAIFALGNANHRPSDNDIIKLSDGTAIVLIVLYAFYLLSTVFMSGDAKAKPTAVESTDEAPVNDESVEVEHAGGMKLSIALALLAGSTIAIVFMSEILVGVIEPTAKDWGLSELFVGVMLVPLVGNVAEHLVAVQMAMKNKMDLSFGIAIGSAVQIALFVAPVLVLVSQFVGPDPMTLVFNQFELVALVAAILITVMISVDGRSNWLEGLQLISLYVIIGIAFFFMP